MWTLPSTLGCLSKAIMAEDLPIYRFVAKGLDGGRANYVAGIKFTFKRVVEIISKLLF